VRHDGFFGIKQNTADKCILSSKASTQRSKGGEDLMRAWGLGRSSTPTAIATAGAVTTTAIITSYITITVPAKTGGGSVMLAFLLLLLSSFSSLPFVPGI